MSKSMRGAYLLGDDKVELRDVEVPEPGSGQVLIKVKASGICGSDIGFIYHRYLNYKAEPAPPYAYEGVICGHEPCGQIVKVGPGCHRFAEGDDVIVYHIAGCGQCWNCRKGYPVNCSNYDYHKAYGWQRDGGNATYCLVEEGSCVPLPGDLDYEDGAIIACGFGTAYEGLKKVDLNGGDTLFVVGLGPIGLAASMCARALGVSTVVGVDVSPSRVEFARARGIVDHAGLVNDDTADWVRSLFGGRGPTVSVDASGANPGRQLAIRATAEWGRVALLGEKSDVTIDVSDSILHKHLTISGTWVTSVWAMETLAELLARRDIHPHDMVSDRYTLEEVSQAYATTAGNPTGKVVVLPEG